MSKETKLFLVLGLVTIILFKVVLDLAPKEGWFGLFTGLYVCLGLAAVYLAKGRKPLDVFSPLLPALVLSYLYAASSALNTEATGMTVYQDVITHDVLKTYYLACILGEIGLSLGFIFAAGRLVRSDQPESGMGPTDEGLLRLSLWLALLLGLACFPWMIEHFDFINVKPYSETALAGRLAKQAMGETQPLQEVFLGKVPSVLITVLCLLVLFKGRRLVLRMLAGLILLANLGTSMLGGQRMSLAMTGTVLLVFIHYRIKALGIKSLASVFVGGFLMTSTLSFVRHTNNLSQMLVLVMEGLKSGGGGGAGAFLAFQNSTEFVVGQNLMRLIAGIREGQTHFTYGHSILTELSVFIPRALFPSRPLPMPDQFVVVFYPGVHETGAGYGFFNLMEGYWAFGLPGVALFAALYGIILFRIYKYFALGKMTDFKAVWYGYVIFAVVFTAGRSGLIGLLKTAMLNSIPFLILLVIRHLLRAWKVRGACVTSLPSLD